MGPPEPLTSTALIKKQALLSTTFLRSLLQVTCHFDKPFPFPIFSSDMPEHIRKSEIGIGDEGLDKILRGKNTPVLADTLHFESKTGNILRVFPELLTRKKKNNPFG